MPSKHLSESQISGIDKIGNVMFPGGEGFPSFTQIQCSRHLDRILDYMPQSDLKDLGMLLTLMSILPTGMVRGFVFLLEKFAGFPGPLGSLLRTIRIGLRGLIMSLYYGDPAVHELVGYEVSVYTADQK